MTKEHSDVLALVQQLGGLRTDMTFSLITSLKTEEEHLRRINVDSAF